MILLAIVGLIILSGALYIAGLEFFFNMTACLMLHILAACTLVISGFLMGKYL